MKRGAVIASIVGAVLLLAVVTLIWEAKYGRPTDTVAASDRTPAFRVVTRVDGDREPQSQTPERLIASPSSAAQDLERDRWADAAERVVRLPPDSFPGVPAAVRRMMDKDGCRVPQRGTPRDESPERGFGRVQGYQPPAKPTNVISGEFGAAAQRDWAVLCSINGRSSIRVYWGGPAMCPASLESVADVNLLQDYAFDYAIERATIPDMRRIARNVAVRDADLNLPPLTHDGIHFSAEKASILHYCLGGKWLTFDGLTNLP